MKSVIYSLQAWVPLSSCRELEAQCTQLLTDSGFHVLSIERQEFEPQGLTAVWVLSESHLAIHTFPENSNAYLELSSCVAEPFRSFERLCPWALEPGAVRVISP